MGDGNTIGILDGYVSRSDSRGWIELTKFRQGDSAAPLDQYVLVYIFELNPDRSLNDLLDTFVVVTEVHRIHLWGSLAGFATGVRSTISQSPHLRLKRSRSLEASRVASSLPCGGLGGDICNSKCILFLLWQALACGRIRSGIGSCGLGEQRDEIMNSVLQRVLPADLAPFEVPPDILSIETASDFAFYIIRAGNDLDWLCSMLPEVLNCRHVLKLAQRLCKRRKPPSDKGCEYRTEVGLCGRHNQALGLSFVACVVGIVKALNREDGIVTIADATGSEVVLYVEGGVRVSRPSDLWAVVVVQPCILVEEQHGTLPTVSLVAPSSKVHFIDMSSEASVSLDSEPLSPVQPPCGSDITSLLQIRKAGEMSVRRVLSVNPGDIPLWTCRVAGIVVFKEPAATPRWTADHGRGGGGPLEGGTTGGNKVAITVRDKSYADKISVFIDSSCASGIAIGSIVSIQMCTLRLNKSQKHVYIEFDRKMGSSIGVP